MAVTMIVPEDIYHLDHEVRRSLSRHRRVSKPLALSGALLVGDCPLQPFESVVDRPHESGSEHATECVQEYIVVAAVIHA
jgi:hypothetical protein